MVYNIYIDDSIVFDRTDWEILSPIKYNFSEKKDADVLCVGIKRSIDEKYISDFPSLKYILSPATGSDHIADAVIDKYKIIKLIPREVGEIKASSEFTIFLTLSILRKSLSIFKQKDNIIGEDIYGKTVGLLGYGRIGKNVYKVFKSMGVNVIYHDIAYRNGVSKEDVLKTSDIIIVLVSCNKDNIDYIAYRDFLKMEKKPYFINVTRGFVVNEYALLNALINQKIKGAALDVVENINIFKNYLKYNDNLIITPHLAGSTYQSYEKACNYIINEFKKVVSEEEV